ncbi:MAG: tRNA 2-thiouridine(34) synthase MnmA [Pontiellaceae bacterium]
MQSNKTKIRVAVGMSGGTDSSAVAAMLVDQGYEVIGLTAHMWKEGSRCCSLEDVERARTVCDFLDIRHYVVNAQEVFAAKIVDPFVDGYAAGETPSPCIQCNAFIKFGFLLTRAEQLGCQAVATGHYARVEKDVAGFYRLFCAKDPEKDQSYFLHRLSQYQLEHLMFPLADLPKPEVRAYSKERGLPIVSRGDSQDLCFIEEGQLAHFVEQRNDSVAVDGEIVDHTGRVVGRHKGLHHFTVGQRGGLGVALGERMYVKRLDKATNRVEIAPRPGVLSDICLVRDLHWIHSKSDASIRCLVRPRYGSRGAWALITPLDGGFAEVQFEEPQFALAPGQAAVFYADTEVLGGGWIDKVPGSEALILKNNTSSISS